MSIQRQHPTAVSNVAVAGSASVWNSPSQALVEDGDNAHTGNIAADEYSDGLRTAHQFSVPTGSTIIGFNVEIKSSNAYGYIAPKEIRIVRPNGSLTETKNQTGRWDATNTWRGYPTGSTDGPEDFDDWGDTNNWGACDAVNQICPDGKWNINHPSVGVYLAVKQVPGSGAGQARVDTIDLLVCFTAP